MLAQQQAQKALAGRRSSGQAVRPCRRALSVRAVATTQKKDASVKPKYNVSPETAKDLYRDMVLGREFEEMCAQMYYRGKMFGFVHLYSGQEAVSTGIIRALEGRDYVCSTYRDHVHALSKGEGAQRCCPAWPPVPLAAWVAGAALDRQPVLVRRRPGPARTAAASSAAQALTRR
jgi:hypothetical protein